MPLCFRTAFRLFSSTRYVGSHTRKLTGFSLMYKDYGDPEKMLEMSEFTVDNNLNSKQVVIKMLAAPVNPADINMVQGKYALKPKLPAVGGNEGVGEVIQVGSDVKNLKVGDRVIPSHAGWGTWRTHAISNEEDFTKIDGEIPVVAAATIAVNPCTAYRMLLDFVDLKAGDTVIQNGANSGVGQAVIQIAKFRGINTINVIRERPNIEQLVDQLKSLGATYVVTEADLRTPCMNEIFSKIPRPHLGLNCVGGKSAAEVVRHLQHKGTFATYGGMSKQPLTISTASLIFNDIRYRGFWMTHWNKEHSMQEREVMLGDITAMIKDGKFSPPTCRQVKFQDYQDAISKSMESYVSEKQVLVM